MFFETCSRLINGLPPQFVLTLMFFAQAFAGQQQGVFGHYVKCVPTDCTKGRHVVETFVNKK